MRPGQPISVSSQRASDAACTAPGLREALASTNDLRAPSHSAPASEVQPARKAQQEYVYPGHVHPAIKDLHRLLRKGLRGTLVPFEMPDELPVADTPSSTTSDRDMSGTPDPKRSPDDSSLHAKTQPQTQTDSQAEPSRPPRMFVHDDLFAAHVQWMEHVAELQPPVKALVAVVAGDSNSNKESSSTSDRGCQADSKSHTQAATAPSSPPAFSFSSARRSHVFDELQRNSKSLLDQKRDAQRDHDRKLREHQLDAWRADVGDRERQLAEHTEEVRQAWITVLPALRVYGAPNTASAQRTLQWLCDQNVVPSNYTECLDVGTEVAERLAPLCPIVVTAAVSAQLIEFIPWASGTTGEPSPFSAPFTDPVWMCGRLALAAGTLSTLAPHVRRLGTSAACIRPDVVLGTVAMWTCGASVPACVTTGAVVQGLAWYVGSNAHRVMHDMWQRCAK